MKLAKAVFALVKDTYTGWLEANGIMLSAALAYYTIFSLAPLMAIAVSVASLVYDRAAVKEMVVTEIGAVVGNEVASLAATAFERASPVPVGGLATGLSLAMLVIGASMMFVRFKLALNALWGIAPHPEKGWIVTLRTHFFSILIVFLICVLLMVSMAISTLLVLLDHYLRLVPQLAAVIERLPEADFGLVFLMFALVFAILFKILPEAQIAWRDVWIGAGVTALIFTVGEFLIGFYLANVNPGGWFGAASSVIVILIWIYYSMQIILLGAKFTQVCSDRHGSGVHPNAKAVRVVRNFERPSTGK